MSYFVRLDRWNRINQDVFQSHTVVAFHTVLVTLYGWQSSIVVRQTSSQHTRNTPEPMEDLEGR